MNGNKIKLEEHRKIIILVTWIMQNGSCMEIKRRKLYQVKNEKKA